MLENYTRRTRSGHGMSDTSQGPGWWLASDGKWYPPELWTGTYPEQAPVYGAAGTVPPGQPGNAAGGPSARHGHAPYADGRSGPYDQPVKRRTNGLAIASLICSCAGVFFLPALLGVVFGFVARGQITRSNGLQQGDGLAIAGIIVGLGWLAFLVLGIALGVGNNDNDVVGPLI
jgi:hypothetical protein